MSFELHSLWQERHDDEHKIRRDDHRSPYQRDSTLRHFDAYKRKLKFMATAWKTFIEVDLPTR